MAAVAAPRAADGREAKGRTQAAGELRANLQLVHRLVVLQCLRVGVNRPELHTLQTMKPKHGFKSHIRLGGCERLCQWHTRREPRALLPAAPLTDRPLEIMRFTALPPPPPQPTTLMRASPGGRGGRCRG